MRLRLKDVEVFEENGTFVKKDLFVMGDRIVDAAEETSFSELSIDVSGLKAISMLVDIHFHGCDGADFCDGTEDALSKIAAYELPHGKQARMWN